MITAMIREFVILYKFGAQTEGGITGYDRKFVVQTVALPSGVIAGEDRDVNSTTMY